MLLLYITKTYGMVIRDEGFLALMEVPMCCQSNLPVLGTISPLKKPATAYASLSELFSHGPANPELAIRAWLEGPDGRVYERTFRPLAQDSRRPHHWIPGERIVAKTAVWVPAGAPAGTYQAFVSFIYADREPIPLEGRLRKVFQDTPGILHLGPVDIVPSSRGLLDDSEIYEKYGAPLHERTMEDVESRRIYHGSLHER